MEQLNGRVNTPVESPLARMQQRIDTARISNKEDFWKLVIDLSVDFPGYSRSQIAETLMARTSDLPEEIARDIDVERIEMNKFDLVLQDLNQMSLESESEYRRILEHLTQSRGLSKEMVRRAILQECFIDSDLRDLIESEGVDIPKAFGINLAARLSDESSVDKHPPKETRSIPTRVIEAVRNRLDSEAYTRELKALEGMEAAVSEGKGIYEMEAKLAGKAGYAFVREVVARMDSLDMTEYPDLAEKIAVAVAVEVERGRSEDSLRSIQFDPNDQVLNMVGRYIAIALHRKMSS